LADWRSQRKQRVDRPYAGGGHAYNDSGKSQREIEVEQENAELRRANEMLKDALVFLQKTGRSKNIPTV
jgi:transposase